MTEQGISGIPVFQLSAIAARALAQGTAVTASIDFAPDFDEKAWEKELARRLSENKNCMLSVYFLGLVNRKILGLVLKRRGMQAEMKASRLSQEALRGIMEDLRAFPIAIVGTGTFKQAQVTSGGVPLEEMDENLQSVRTPGLFMAGELVDVDGICGGYNLQWAMTSGWIAGKGAAKATQGSVQ
jgi:predicted Rossmann fold flavoprotein